MKQNYERPVVDMVRVNIEKGFAASSDSFSIQNFEYDDTTGKDPNTAW